MQIQRKKTVFPLAVIVAMLLLAPLAQGQGAAATSAKIELSSDSYLADSPVTIRVYDVVAAGAVDVVEQCSR